MVIISRSQAKAQGLTRYFTGVACIHGHIAERRVSNSTCQECYKIRWAECWKKADGYKSTRKILYSKRDPETANAKNRKRYHDDPNHQAAATKRYNQKHPERRLVLTRNRRARKRAAEGTHTAVDIKSLFVSQQGLCYCGSNLNEGYHVDHMQPLSRGGSNWPENLQLLCPFCNTSKGAKTMDEWLCKRVAA